MRQLSRREPEPASLLDGLFRRLRELAGRGETDGDRLRETIAELIEDAEDDGSEGFSPEQRTLLMNALAFGQMRVDDVMTPRAEIAAVPATATLAEVVAAMRAAEHPRLVVYRDTLDDVVGVIGVRDLLAFWGDGASFVLEAIAKPVLAVPSSMRVIDLVMDIRATGMHVAIVVDEFGGTDGAVAIEDLVAELLRELDGRYEVPDPGSLRALPDGSIEVDARIDLEELERHLGLTLLGADERDEADTLAGLIVSLADRVPQQGEIVEHPAGLRLEVLDGDARRVRRVRILGLPPAGPAGEPALEA